MLIRSFLIIKRFWVAFYSFLKLFTGFMRAAFKAWKLTVSRVINRIPAPAEAKIHKDRGAWYAYFSSHFCISSDMRGMAMNIERAVSPMKSLDSSDQRWGTLAPRTLRIPISLVRCSATKEARPKRPRQEIKMARDERTTARFPSRVSAANRLA